MSYTLPPPLPTWRPSFLATYAHNLLRLIALGSVALLGFGLYLQHVEGLNPCPMCIVQRYALLLVALIAGLLSWFKARPMLMLGTFLTAVVAGFGAFVAARQSWLQWYPPEVYSCGRDLYGMIETFPLKRAIPMIFRGGGDCTQVDWTFLGLSIANWSFLNFVLIGVLALAAFVAVWRNPR